MQGLITNAMGFSVPRRILLLSVVLPLFLASGFASYAATGSSTHLLKTITVGSYPQFLGYDPSNKLMYVVNNNGGEYCDCYGTVSIVNGSTNSVIKTVSLGGNENSWGILYNPSNHELYIANAYTNTISVLKGLKVIKTISGVDSPYYLAYDPSNKMIYTAGGRVTVIDSTTNTIRAYLNATDNTGSLGLVYDPANHEIYATATDNTGDDLFGGDVWAIKGTTIVADIKVGSSGSGPDDIGFNSNFLAYDPANKCVYVPTSATDSVSVINGTTNKVVANVTVGVNPVGVTFDPANKNVYVSNFGSSSVSVISSKTDKVLTTITVPPNPLLLTYDPANKDMYLGIAGGYNFPSTPVEVVVLGPSNKLLASISTNGDDPIGFMYDPSNGLMYAGSDGGTVSVLSS